MFRLDHSIFAPNLALRDIFRVVHPLRLPQRLSEVVTPCSAAARFQQIFLRSSGASSFSEESGFCGQGLVHGVQSITHGHQRPLRWKTS